jgi:hypothetical protein
MLAILIASFLTVGPVMAGAGWLISRRSDGPVGPYMLNFGMFLTVSLWVAVLLFAVVLKP